MKKLATSAFVFAAVLLCACSTRQDQLPKGEWIDLLEAAGVPCAPIHTLPEAVAQPQAAAIGMIQPVPGDDYELVALPLSFDGARPGIRLAPPKPGEHTREIRGG